MSKHPTTQEMEACSVQVARMVEEIERLRAELEAERTAKAHAVQQAQVWKMEADTQRSIAQELRNRPCICGPVAGGGGGKFWRLDLDTPRPIMAKCCSCGAWFGSLAEVHRHKWQHLTGRLEPFGLAVHTYGDGPHAIRPTPPLEPWHQVLLSENERAVVRCDGCGFFADSLENLRKHKVGCR